MRGFSIFLLLAGGPALFSPLPLSAVEEIRTARSRVRLVTEFRSVQPSQSFWAGLSFRLRPGWHVYWRNPGDSGEAPRLEWKKTGGARLGPLLFPPPEKILLSGGSGSAAVTLANYGYHGEVTLPLRVEAPASPAGGMLRLSAAASWLVCQTGGEGVCVPEGGVLELSLPVRMTPAPSEHRAALQEAVASLPSVLPESRMTYEVGGGDFILTVRSPALREIPPDAAFTFFPLTEGILVHAAPQTVRREGDRLLLRTRAETPFPRDAERATGVLTVRPPPAGTSGAFEVEAPRTGGGLLPFALLLALAGGALLNLMPCVFPVLSLKVLQFIEEGGRHPARVRRHGWAYTAGVLACFAVLGGALALLRAGGREFGWGFQLQSPPFVLVLCFVFLLLALSLFGLFEIGTSLTAAGSSLARGGGYSGSFLTGALAAVVATPCTAPLMGPAVAFGLSQPPGASLAVFLALGAGMAAPYLALAHAPALLRRLPRPGPWMVTFREAMGFLLLLALLWLLWVYSQLVSPEGLVHLLLGLTLAGAGFWLARVIARHGVQTAWPKRLAASLLLTLGVLWALRHAAPSTGGGTATFGEADGWEEFSPARVEELVRSGRPVFVDFTAAWCLTCQVNKKAALENTAVRARLRELNVALVRADWTRRDPEIGRALARHGREGVPLYLLYEPGKGEPRILPQILTPDVVLGELERLGGAP